MCAFLKWVQNSPKNTPPPPLFRLSAPGSTGIGSFRRPGESGKSLLDPLWVWEGEFATQGVNTRRPRHPQQPGPPRWPFWFGCQDDSLPTSPLTPPPRYTLVKLSPSLEHGVPPLQAPFEVLRGSTLLACLAHRLGTLVQFVPREGRAPASVWIVRLERDGRRVR